MDGFSVDAVIVAAIIALIGLLINGMWLEPKRAREARKYEWDKLREEREYEKKKQEKEQEIRKLELRDALYSELAHLYCLLKETLDPYTSVHLMEGVLQVPDEITRVVKIMSDIKDNYFGVYKFTRKDPVLFYQLSDAHAIDSIYRYFAWMTDEIIALFGHYEKALPSPADISSVAKNQRLKVGRYLDAINDVLTQSVTSGLEIDLLAQFVTREECKRFINESVKEAKSKVSKAKLARI